MHLLRCVIILSGVECLYAILSLYIINGVEISAILLDKSIVTLVVANEHWLSKAYIADVLPTGVVTLHS